MKTLPVLSPSGVRLWQNSKALFILKYIYQTRSSGSNIYAIRGIAVETGMNKNVIDCPQRIDTSIALPECLNKFSELTKQYAIGQDTADEFRPTVTGFITNGLVQLSSIFGGLDKIKSQVPIEYQHNGFTIRGYIDYMSDDMLVDLKCTNKIPTIVTRGPRKDRLIAYKANDVLQVCMYKRATGLEPTLLYVSEKDTLIYPISQEEFKEVDEKISLTLDEIKYALSLSHDDMLRYTIPDKFDDFYWDGELINAAKHIWSL